jgi:hypothetical protein
VVVATGALLRIVVISLLTPRMIAPILEATDEMVETIDIACGEPHRIPFREPSTFQVVESTWIAVIASELSSASEYSPNHPNCGTHCVITLNTTRGSFPVEANWNCIDPEIGTLIYFRSNVTWGLSLATYRSEGLGRAIDNAIVAGIEHNRSEP